MLQLTDELNMELMVRIRNTARDAAIAAGQTPEEHAAFAVIDKMIAAGRPARVRGAGFYEYEDGKRTRIWPGLAELFPTTVDPSTISLRDLEERMLFIEAIETVKCVDEGVIESVADANIGSIMGIGFPAWTGGVLQYINGYEGGLSGFVARARELADGLRRALRAPGVTRRPRRARRDLHRRGNARQRLTTRRFPLTRSGRTG